ncbi:hypothetical protein ES705_32252 [subsurface metagenome]
MAALSTDKQIVNKISNHRRGKIFFPENFVETGSVDAIRQALHRLEQDKFLVRLTHGIYLYPKKDEVLGVLYPPVEEIAQAIARRDKARIIPTGVHALNKLGLSTQVPMKVVYLTDGAPRDIQVGNRRIRFKKTTPKNLAMKGEISGLVIQALREIGKDKATPEQLERIGKLLKDEKPETISHDARLAPAWIAKIMRSALRNNKKL